MKKVIILVMIMAIGTVAFAEVIVKGGVNLGSKLTIDYQESTVGYKNYNESNNVDVKKGFNLGAEYGYDLTSNVAIGVGVGYFSLPKREDEFDYKITWIPVYGLVKQSIPLSETFSQFIEVQLGYGTAMFGNNYDEADNKTGGFYFGIGGGVKVKNIIFELVYSKSKAHFEGSYNEYFNGSDHDIKQEFDLSYPKVNFNMGICF